MTEDLSLQLVVYGWFSHPLLPLKGFLLQTIHLNGMKVFKVLIVIGSFFLPVLGQVSFLFSDHSTWIIATSAFCSASSYLKGLVLRGYMHQMLFQDKQFFNQLCFEDSHLLLDRYYHAEFCLSFGTLLNPARITYLYSLPFITQNCFVHIHSLDSTKKVIKSSIIPTII